MVLSNLKKNLPRWKRVSLKFKRSVKKFFEKNFPIWKDIFIKFFVFLLRCLKGVFTILKALKKRHTRWVIAYEAKQAQRYKEFFTLEIWIKDFCRLIYLFCRPFIFLWRLWEQLTYKNISNLTLKKILVFIFEYLKNKIKTKINSLKEKTKKNLNDLIDFLKTL